MGINEEIIKDALESGEIEPEDLECLDELLNDFHSEEAG